MGALLRFIVAVVTPPVVVAFIVASLDDLALSLANPPLSSQKSRSTLSQVRPMKELRLP
jgi:hypothetical protein